MSKYIDRDEVWTMSRIPCDKCNKPLCLDCKLWEFSRLLERHPALEVDLDGLLSFVTFAQWVASEVCQDDGTWELNHQSFQEIACRKLADLGVIRLHGDTYAFESEVIYDEIPTETASADS